MKITTRVAAAALGMAMLFTAAGCATDTSWVYEADGDRMPAGVYIHYMLDAASDATSRYMEEQDTTDNWSYPELKDVLSGQVEGSPAADWITARAKESAQEYYAVKTLAEAKGFALSEEDEAMVRSNTQIFWSGAAFQQYMWPYYDELYEKNGVSQPSVERYIHNATLKYELFKHLYGEGGEMEVSLSEIRDSFQESYAKAAYLSIYKDIVTDDAEEQDVRDIEVHNAELRTLAEGYLARMQEGEALEDIVYDYREYTASEGVEVERPADGELDQVLSIPEDPDPETLYGAIALATADEVTLVETDSVLYLILRKDVLADAADLENYRDTVLQTLRYDEYEELLKGTAVNMTANESAVSRYKPSNLKMS